MTPKQIERVQNKIKKIRKALSDERRRFGGYHDGRGLRYAPFELYLKIQDYKGGATYLRWFLKNFPDDYGFPTLWIMSSIIYFKNKKKKEAEKMVLTTFFNDPVVFNIFIDTPIEYVTSTHFNLDAIQEFYTELQQKNDLSDFKTWLLDFTTTEKFLHYKKEYLLLEEKLTSSQKESERKGILELQSKLTDLSTY
ncbi:hypothetical protein KMW28_24475 [Flammeovirga yaeyamensis]|uniref:Uncharacterized protein n=1 Tax=Flammeovirga yaeyamensis TaxID=367791 RepID=A0AAX1N993_9BACT|nr:hypothetical protein [Flammeovirga yaeyamensis]MBB3699558.1 hypothetical protein [Flammeovirga yaeyamensis]NMF35187.1 hypothetical protein [Flammeovirga yaeyamensis]QWG04051.1 hypothetical protein KMW28_24475 [Flammeovirga yaeyamensis]